MGGRQSSSSVSGSLFSSSSNTPRLSNSNAESNSGISNNSFFQIGSTRTNRGFEISSSDWRQRARSLTNVITNTQPHHSHNSSNGQQIVTVPPLGHSSFGLSNSPDNFSSIEDIATFNRIFSAQSLPVPLIPFNGKLSFLIFFQFRLFKLLFNLFVW